MPGTIPVPELASWASDLSAKTEKHRTTIAKEITVTWTAVRLGTLLMRSMLQSGSTGVSIYERHMRKVNTYCKWCYIQQMKDPASICIKKKKCHRKIFMSAKINKNETCLFSTICTFKSRPDTNTTHFMSLHDKQKHSWEKKRMYTAVCWLSQQGVQAGMPVKLLTDSQRYQHYDSLWSPSHSKSPTHDINDDNALSPTVDIWLVPNLWEHTHHMIWQMKLTRVMFAKYV